MFSHLLTSYTGPPLSDPISSPHGPALFLIFPSHPPSLVFVWCPPLSRMSPKFFSGLGRSVPELPPSPMTLDRLVMGPPPPRPWVLAVGDIWTSPQIFHFELSHSAFSRLVHFLSSLQQERVTLPLVPFVLLSFMCIRFGPFLPCREW